MKHPEKIIVNISKMQTAMLLAFVVASAGATAQDVTEALPQGTVRLPVALLDTRLDSGQDFSFPSMQQSLQMVWAVDRITLLGIQKAYAALLPEREGIPQACRQERRRTHRASAVTFSFALTSAYKAETYTTAIITSDNVSVTSQIAP